jgi:hypothetical protein
MIFMKKSALVFKIFKIALLLCLLLILAACGNGNNNNGGEGGLPADGGSGDNVEEQQGPRRPPTLPADLKFSGQTIRIYNMQGESSTEFLLEQATNIVDEAIYQKNMRVMDNLGIDMHFGYPSEKEWSAQGNSEEVVRLMMAGDFEYDFIFGPQYMMVYLTGHEYLSNLHNLPHIDINEPWWAKKYIDEVTVGDHTRFFLAGDIALEFVQYGSTLFYNKKLYEDLINPDNAAELYDIVLAGEWTFDVFSEMVRGVYLNLDGTGSVNIFEDRFGTIVQRVANSDHYFYPMNPRVTIRDESGIPRVNVHSEHTIAALTKLRDLFDSNPGSVDFTGIDISWSEQFMSNRLLFMPSSAIFSAQGLTDMASDYGIIPMPKFDERQPEYLAVTHDAAPIIAVPSNAVRVDLIGAVLEEMAYFSFHDVSPVYFNHALKFRYARDASDEASQMIDIIRDGATTDFGYVYGLLIVDRLNEYNNNGLGYIQRFITRNPRIGIASQIDRRLPVWEAKLDELVDLYLE